MTELFHGTWWEQHKHQKYEQLQPGRFTKLLEGLEPAQFDLRDLELLARRMTSRQERSPTPEGRRDPEEGKIPAAYTYLGQFVDHDLTFDPTSQLRDFMTPRPIGRGAG